MDRIKTIWAKTNRWHRTLLLFFIVESRLLPGGQVGFECNDPALSYPFTGDTINFKWLFVVTIFLPLIMILLVERQKDRSESNREQALQWYREYLFGLLINVTVVQMLKLIVGSPRPHFFETCQPQEALTCKDSEYVPSYTCTQAHWLKQSDKSFPSGHTSLAVHCALFVAYYLHHRATAARWVTYTQVSSVLAAAVCGVSRMTDHRHHWWDVLAGVVLSLPILGYTMFYGCSNFKCQIRKEEKCEDKPQKTEELKKEVAS
ncbi:phospholipid phosphatase 1-like [Aricia agestis]|uniref:phospholipid phosphatase 1-like n=1 Tax=Aricia agestis TaxID=91739 RepID=UPI001C20B8C5|nr:phospholipid phosphatase 1-like [Aricia agestis]